jgi:hypothetical protein
MEGFCEQGDESLVSMKAGNFFTKGELPLPLTRPRTMSLVRL